MMRITNHDVTMATSKTMWWKKENAWRGKRKRKKEKNDKKNCNNRGKQRN